MRILDKFLKLNNFDFTKENFSSDESHRFIKKYKILMIFAIITLILIYIVSMLIFIIPDNSESNKILFTVLFILVISNISITIVISTYITKRLNIFIKHNKGKNKERIRFKNLLISSSSIMGILCLIICGLEALGKLDSVFTVTIPGSHTNKQSMNKYSDQQNIHGGTGGAGVNNNQYRYNSNTDQNIFLRFLSETHNRTLIYLGLLLSGIMLQFISCGIMIGHYMVLKAELAGKEISKPILISV
jgi:nitrogen fixation/metabolism regulation signal transduction histidine kinase